MKTRTRASRSCARAIQSPIRQIVENAGVEASIVVGKLLEQKSNTFGFDAQTEKYVDLIEAGIVDPTKVVRMALQNAALGRGPADHDRSDGRRSSEEGHRRTAMPGGGGMGDMDF